MEAKIEEVATATPQDATLANLQKIIDTQQKLTTIKSALKDVLDSVQENPSILDRFSTSWSESSTAEKIAAGSLTITPGIAIPILKALGILFIPGYGVGALAAISVGSLFFYLAVDEHNDKSIESKLKKGILSIGDIL